MKNFRFTACLVFTLLVTAFTLPQISQAGIVLDFTGDTFFAGNPVAKAALEAAATDINEAIDFSCLGAVTNDVISGTSGGSVANFGFTKLYNNPADGVLTQTPNSQIVAGQVNVFVGARTFLGNTLGVGGPGFTGPSAGGLDAGNGTLAMAVANAEANEQHRRGGGPIVATVNQSLGGVAFSFDQGLHTGSVAFNDAANWHFDHTTAVTAGTSDFYSVALHELLHTVGFGVSASWQSLVSGTDYLGVEGIAANGGSGTGLVAGAGDHLAANISSPRITDGVLQEVIMDPDLTLGTRKYLTELDLAVMRDLGLKTFATTAVPEPSAFAFLLLGGVAFCGRRRKRAV
jgi:hypothetical protein